MEEKINNNINTTLQHFIYIHNQHPIEVKQMTQHLLRFSFILIHILPILQDNNLSYENKYQYLQKIQYQEQPLFTENTIKIILQNKHNFHSLYLLFHSNPLQLNQNAQITENIQEDGSENTQIGGNIDKNTPTFQNIPFINQIPDEFLFPLNAIESNIPISSLLMEWALYLSTIIAVFTKLVTPFVEYIMNFGADLFWTILGGIPLFGFDPIVSALSIPMKYGFELYIKFIVSLINAMPHLYKFMVQLSRKNFDDAIREFSQITVLFSQLHKLFEKFLPLLNNNLIFINEYMPTILKFAEPIAGLYLKSIHIFNNLLLQFVTK